MKISILDGHLRDALCAMTVMETLGNELLPESARGLVFDCDGTLIDSMPLHFAAWKVSLKYYVLRAPGPS